MPRRDQGSKPTPKGFRYYRQGIHMPNTVRGSARRGSLLTRAEVYEEVNKKLAEHADATLGKVRVNEPLKKPPFSRNEGEPSDPKKVKKGFQAV